jgi:hypothetical protein
VADDGVRLVPSPAEQAVISRAKELSDAGLPVRAIAQRLADEGVTNRSGRAFKFQSVHVFLRPLLG